MHTVSKILTNFLIATALWCADSLLLSLCSGLPFVSCLWSGAAPLRLLLRLLTVVILLLCCLTSIVRQELIFQRYQRLPGISRTRLFGDPDSRERADRLQYHCLRLAALLHMDSADQDKLRMLCHCYDIGDMEGLPRAEQLRLAQTITGTASSLAPVSTLLLYQDEEYDGHGPFGVGGRRIPLSCRIFHAARLYDSFLYQAADKPVLSREEALSQLTLCAGTALDPQVAAIFRQLLTDQSAAEESLRYVIAHS